MATGGQALCPVLVWLKSSRLASESLQAGWEDRKQFSKYSIDLEENVFRSVLNYYELPYDLARGSRGSEKRMALRKKDLPRASG